jgi:hypothetical protein
MKPENTFSVREMERAALQFWRPPRNGGMTSFHIRRALWRAHENHRGY